MLSSTDGKMIILSSPSGAGKTTLVKKISKEKNFKVSISHTTREPRANEINGVDYYFTSLDNFKKLVEENAFLEYAKVFQNLYGSTKKQVFNYLENGYNVLFDIDWQGAQQIKNQTLNHQLISYFILPPSREILYKRLIFRGETNDKTIQMRMKQFDRDVLHWIDYDFVVINDNLNECYDEISQLIDLSLKPQNKEIHYNKKRISDHVDKLIN